MVSGLAQFILAILLCYGLSPSLFPVADAADTSDARALPSPTFTLSASATGPPVKTGSQLPEQLKGRRLIQRSPQIVPPLQKIMAASVDDSHIWLSVDGTKTVTVTTAPVGSPCGAAHMTRSVCETPTAACTPDGNGKSTCHAVPKVEAISTTGEQTGSGLWLSSDASRTIFITTASINSRCGAAFGTRTVCPDYGQCARIAGQAYSTCSQMTTSSALIPSPTPTTSVSDATDGGVWLSSDASRTVTVSTASANERCGAQFGTRTLCPSQYTCSSILNQGYSACTSVSADVATSTSSVSSQTPSGVWASTAPSTTIYITTAAFGERCGAQFGTRTVCPGNDGRCASVSGKGMSTCTTSGDSSPTTSIASSMTSSSALQVTTTSVPSATSGLPSSTLPLQTTSPSTINISSNPPTSTSIVPSVISSSAASSSTATTISSTAITSSNTVQSSSSSSQVNSASLPVQTIIRPSSDIRDSFLVGGSVGTLPRLEALPSRQYLDVSGTKVVDAMEFVAAAGMNVARVHTSMGMCSGPTLSFDNSEGWAEREKNYRLDWGCIDLQVSVAKRAQNRSMKVIHAINMGQDLPPTWYNLTYVQVLDQIAIEVERQLQPFLDASIQADIIIIGTEETDGMLYRQVDPVTGKWINNRGVPGANKTEAVLRQELIGELPTGNLASWPQLAGYYKHIVATAKRLIAQSSRDPSRTLFGLHSHGQYFPFKNGIVYNKERSEVRIGTFDFKSVIPAELYNQSCSDVLDVMGFSGYPDPMHPSDLDGPGLERSFANVNRNLAASQFIAEKYGRNENGRYNKVALLLETASAYDYNAAGIADQDTFTHIFLNRLLAEDHVLGVLWWEPMYGRNYWMGGTAALTREWGATRLPARQAALTFYAYAKAKR